ncbi:hypothetical protein NEHOM01_1391 [Nematocida homosporus]|uniref:uncharacterized protein n=1 Tax=Nematocida homosporus TaxID=1912981 RepID=UPI002220A475|nr:uncharacterized protein NEHOM01_1391 [Nematocida homosporus]KAI5186327.1 hypothetical protein NEHOM01_1391 [Nematocida homosporus]
MITPRSMWRKRISKIWRATKKAYHYITKQGSGVRSCLYMIVCVPVIYASKFVQSYVIYPLICAIEFIGIQIRTTRAIVLLSPRIRTIMFPAEGKEAEHPVPCTDERVLIFSAEMSYQETLMHLKDAIKADPSLRKEVFPYTREKWALNRISYHSDIALESDEKVCNQLVNPFFMTQDYNRIQADIDRRQLIKIVSAQDIDEEIVMEMFDDEEYKSLCFTHYLREAEVHRAQCIEIANRFDDSQDKHEIKFGLFRLRLCQEFEYLVKRNMKIERALFLRLYKARKTRVAKFATRRAPKIQAYLAAQEAKKAAMARPTGLSARPLPQYAHLAPPVKVSRPSKTLPLFDVQIAHPLVVDSGLLERRAAAVETRPQPKVRPLQIATATIAELTAANNPIIRTEIKKPTTTAAPLTPAPRSLSIEELQIIEQGYIRAMGVLAWYRSELSNFLSLAKPQEVSRALVSTASEPNYIQTASPKICRESQLSSRSPVQSTDNLLNQLQSNVLFLKQKARLDASDPASSQSQMAADKQEEARKERILQRIAKIGSPTPGIAHLDDLARLNRRDR